jgi:hypothetical protein
MSLTAERIAERVAEMIHSIRGSVSYSFAQHNADKTITFIKDAHEAALVSPEQYLEMSSSVCKALNEWPTKQDGGHHEDLPTLF